MWALINSLTFNQGHIEEVESYEIETTEMSTQTENSARTSPEPPTTREIACQTNLDEEGEASDIRLNFNHCHDPQYLQNLLKLEWPTQAYHKTELATGIGGVSDKSSHSRGYCCHTSFSSGCTIGCRNIQNG